MRVYRASFPGGAMIPKLTRWETRAVDLQQYIRKHIEPRMWKDIRIDHVLLDLRRDGVSAILNGDEPLILETLGHYHIGPRGGLISKDGRHKS